MKKRSRPSRTRKQMETRSVFWQMYRLEWEERISKRKMDPLPPGKAKTRRKPLPFDHQSLYQLLPLRCNDEPNLALSPQAKLLRKAKNEELFLPHQEDTSQSRPVDLMTRREVLLLLYHPAGNLLLCRRVSAKATLKAITTTLLCALELVTAHPTAEVSLGLLILSTRLLW